jgi:hypothetical protein
VRQFGALYFGSFGPCWWCRDGGLHVAVCFTGFVHSVRSCGLGECEDGTQAPLRVRRSGEFGAKWAFWRYWARGGELSASFGPFVAPAPDFGGWVQCAALFSSQRSVGIRPSCGLRAFCFTGLVLGLGWWRSRDPAGFRRSGLRGGIRSSARHHRDLGSLGLVSQAGVEPSGFGRSGPGIWHIRGFRHSGAP